MKGVRLVCRNHKGFCKRALHAFIRIVLAYGRSDSVQRIVEKGTSGPLGACRADFFVIEDNRNLYAIAGFCKRERFYRRIQHTQIVDFAARKKLAARSRKAALVRIVEIQVEVGNALGGNAQFFGNQRKQKIIGFAGIIQRA